MAGSKPRVDVPVGVDERAAVQGLKNLVTRFRDASTGINQSLELINKGWGVVTGAVNGVIGAVKEYIQLADIQRAAEIRLATAMKQRGDFTSEAFEELKAYASELQGLTVIGDEATLGMMSQLRVLGVNTSQMKEAARATIGLAEVTGSLESATVLVAKAYGGKVEALKKVGIEAKNTKDAIAQATGLFALAEARASTFMGRITQLTNAWGDLKENIGFIVLNSSAIRSIIETLTRFVGDIGSFDSTRATMMFDRFLRWFAGQAAWLLEAMQKIGEEIALAFSKAEDAITRLNDAARVAERPVASFAKAVGRELADLGSKMLEGLEASRGVTYSRAVALKQTLTEQVQEPAVRTKTAIDELVDSLRALAGAPAAVADDIANIPRPPKPKGQPRAPREIEVPERGFAPSVRGDSIDVDYLIAQARADSELLRGVPTQAELDAAVRRGQQATKRIQAEVFDPYRMMLDQEMKELQALDDIMTGIAQSFVGTLSSAFSQMFADLVSGQKTFLESLSSFFGGIMVQMGSLLVQLGTAGVLAGSLGSVIPALAAITGGPLGVGLGMAAIAGGAAMIAAGAALGGGGAGAAGASASTAGGRAPAGGGPGPRLGYNDAFSRRSEAGEGRTTVIHFNGVVADDRRRLGYTIRELLEEADSLQPARG